MQKIRIILTADMQYKDRQYSLSNSYELVSNEIERILVETQADVYAFAGDFTEYPTPNDSERSLMFKHLGNALNITTLKEMVVMNGNHDLILGKKLETSQKENNPLDTFVKSTKAINPQLFKKINYLKKQQEYNSIANELISWVSYSLEDGTSTGSNLILSEKNNNKYRIPVFHDILKEYVDDKKLPISKSKYEYLMKLEDFKTNEGQKGLIIAGDIHENYMKLLKINDNYSKFFIYPGSPIQRNHGEGSYFKVRTGAPIIKNAAPKFVKQIDVFIDENNINESYFEVKDIELKNTLHYITIDLNTKKYVENWKDQLNHLLNNIKISNICNIIKLELSNIYMKYEMEIISMVNNYFQAKHDELACINYIELNYGQVVFDKDEIVIDDEVNEIETDEIKEDNIEDIILNQEKLKLIFNKLIESNNKNILKEFTNPEEFNEVVDELTSLFEEQIDITYGSKTAYKTDFEKVTTNGFMALGPNEIKLNIPGLTRIVGNNGIGKTTLFNLLRWIIKGYVLEGLPKNTKKENLLLIFNVELPEKDFIINTLYLKVNDITVEIERNAKRTWKKSATLENKKSLNWKTFIDTVTSNLTLRIYPKDKDTVVKMNDEAQMLIDQWFGNTIETIFILNQFKILQLLNSSGDELKESALDYIGVDYTKSLVTNLEIVKPNYLVSKPEKSQMDIVVEKNKATQTILSNNQKIEEQTLLLENETKSQVIIKNNIELKNNELINIGNTPEKLKTTQNKLNEFEELKNNFEVKTPKVLPIFDKSKPIKNTVLIESLEQKINELKTNIESINKNIDDNQIKFEELKNSKLNICNNNINTLNSENENILISGKNIFVEKNTEIIEILKSEKNKYLNNYNSKLNDEKSNFETKKTQLNNDSNELKLKLNDKVNRVNSLRNEIDNDICSGCNRPIGLTPEIIREKEDEILKINSEITIINDEINDKQSEIIIVNNKINEINNKITDFTLLLNWNLNYTSKNDFVTELNTIKENLLLFDNNENSLLIINLNKGIENWDNFDKIVEDEKYKTNLLTIEKLNKLKEILSKLSIISEITEELTAIKFIEDLLLIIGNYVSDKNELNKLNEKLIIDENLLKTENTTYNSLINEYNELLTKHNDEVTKINEYNTSIIEYNKLPIEYDNNIKRLQQDLIQLNLDKLIFDKLNEELFDLKNELENCENNILNYNQFNTQYNNDNILLNNNINLLNDLENKWKEYRKKNFIYKTYEKLIKNDFKMAIFNYYRTFLNNKLNILLEGLDFRLYWNNDSNLYLTKFSKNENGNTEMVYLPVKLASGMQTTFLGLSLIYSFHLLNIKNSLSHIFIDEISGQLNSGKNNGINESEDLIDEATKKNYQEQLVFLLSKFDKKKLFIVDHVIEQLYDTHTYYVKRKLINNSKVTIFE